MVDLNAAISVITVNVNESNTAIKRQILTIHNYLICTRNTLNTRTKIGWKKKDGKAYYESPHTRIFM